MAASAKAPAVPAVARHERTPPPPLMFTGERQIQRAQGEHGGEEHDAHDAQVDEQAHNRAAEQERGQRLPPEGAVREPERNHEHDEEGHILGVEEGVRVDARMQQEQHHGQKRQRPAAE